jgi:putative ABC transport system permease protein
MAPRRRLFRLFTSRRRTREEMREELVFHLEARTAQLIARGVAPDAARAEALRRLGRPLDDAEAWLARSAELKEKRLNMRERIDGIVDDLRYTLRGLARRPAFTAVSILTLAIGIGANTAIYSAVDALLLRSLPFPQPGRVMDISLANPDEGSGPWSFPKFAVFRDAQRSYSSLALHSTDQATLSGPDPERVTIERVTARYLVTLGLRPSLGTDFPAELDAGPNARKLALISDALWQRHFSADEKIVGRTLHLDNDVYEIAGVLPNGFRGLSGRAEALVPITVRGAEDLNEPWSLEFSLVGRLQPDATPQQAIAEARILGRRVYDAYPMGNGSFTTRTKVERWSATARPLDAIRVASSLRRSLLVLFGAVALVLLIACVNLANLLLGRASARRQETAVRLAIGATRGRLVRLLLTESVVLALLGGAASVVVAWWGTHLLSVLNPGETLRVQALQGGIGAVGFDSIRLDPRALLFTFTVTLVVGVVCGLVPALQSTRAELTSALKDGGADAIHGGARRLGISRRSLVVGEVALALVLLAGSGLMIRSLGNLLKVNPGFDADGVLTLRLSIVPGVIAPDSMPGFYEQLQTTVAALPGVKQVALADCPPLNNGCNGTIMTFADRPRTATGNAMVGVHWVTPSWLGTMHVPLKRGRFFGPEDRIGTPRVVVINEEAARRYFPGEDPLGKVVSVYQGGFDKGATIVGIVGDVRFGTVDSTAGPDTYISYNQSRQSRMMIFVRTDGDAAALVPSVRRAIHELAPLDPIYDIRPMTVRVASSTAQARFSALLLGLFAAVALALAVTGIYGVMSFAVAQRTREIGIRMALGADRSNVLALMVRDGAMLAGAGVAIGLGGALALTRLLRTMLFEVTPSDPTTFVAIVVVVGFAALVASWVPARRAAGLDPVRALRG